MLQTGFEKVGMGISHEALLFIIKIIPIGGVVV